MANDIDFPHADPELVARKCRSGMLHSVEYPIDILKVLPYEYSNTRIPWYGFITSILVHILCLSAQNRNVVQKWWCYLQFILEDKGNVALKYRY